MNLVEAILSCKVAFPPFLTHTLSTASSQGNASIVKKLLAYIRSYPYSDEIVRPHQSTILLALIDALKGNHFLVADLLLNEGTDFSIEESQSLLRVSLDSHYSRGIEVACKNTDIFKLPSKTLDEVLISAVEEDYDHVTKAIFKAKAPISLDAYQKICKKAILTSVFSGQNSKTELIAISKIPSLPAPIKDNLIKEAIRGEVCKDCRLLQALEKISVK